MLAKISRYTVVGKMCIPWAIPQWLALDTTELTSSTQYLKECAQALRTFNRVHVPFPSICLYSVWRQLGFTTSVVINCWYIPANEVPGCWRTWVFVSTFTFSLVKLTFCATTVVIFLKLSKAAKWGWALITSIILWLISCSCFWSDSFSCHNIKTRYPTPMVSSESW